MPGTTPPSFPDTFRPAPPALPRSSTITAIREGRWDCSSCGSTRIYGRHVSCPGCGRPRPAGTRFYLAQGEPVVTDPQQLADARAAADWVCARCGASNRASLHDCAGCGGAHEVQSVQPVLDYGIGEVPRTGEAAAIRRAVGPAAASGRSYILHALVGGFLGLCVLIGWVASAGRQAARAESLYSYEVKEPVPAVVADKRWERTVMAQVRSLVPGAGYVLPESAVVLTTVQRRTGESRTVDHYVTTTREVPRSIAIADGYEMVTREVEETVRTGTRTYVCGERDLGNGYFEDRECSEPEYETRTRTVTRREPRYRYETRMETVTERTPVYRTGPVYRTWYTWHQPVWRDTVLTAEGDTTQPAWPRLPRSERLRETDRNERYVIHFRVAPGPDWSEADVTAEEWARYQPGQPVAIRERSFRFELLPADSLPACIRWRAGTAAAPADSLGCTPPPVDSAAVLTDSAAMPPGDSAAADSTG